MVDAVILAGGSAARLDGADKPAIPIGAHTMLDHVLDAVAEAHTVVVVGPRRPVQREVHWCLEEPRGAGPVAALATGLALVRAEVVLVLAADLPWIGPAVPRLLDALDADESAACAVLMSAGRRNYLAAAWRRDALRAALQALPELRGAAARVLYAQTAVIDVVDEDGAGQDCDTWDDVVAARRRIETTQLHEGKPR